MYLRAQRAGARTRALATFRNYSDEPRFDVPGGERARERHLIGLSESGALRLPLFRDLAFQSSVHLIVGAAYLTALSVLCIGFERRTFHSRQFRACLRVCRRISFTWSALVVTHLVNQAVIVHTLLHSTAPGRFRCSRDILVVDTRPVCHGMVIAEALATYVADRGAAPFLAERAFGIRHTAAQGAQMRGRVLAPLGTALFVKVACPENVSNFLGVPDKRLARLAGNFRKILQR